MELLAERSFMDLEMDEVSVGEKSKLVGACVSVTRADRNHGLLFVAIKQPDGNMVFNPDGNHIFGAADTVIVMGRADDIQEFRRECELPAV